MSSFLKKYIQYQKPQVNMLIALSFPLLGAVYNFGWRSAVFVLVAMLCCWGAEYWFTSRENKPASTSALVTGMLLGLISPPNVPFWQIAVGSVFCMVFGKMVFGGFGKNVFNPAMVGRCFLYICFPASLAATWFVPFQGGGAGFAHYTPDFVKARTADVDSSIMRIDAVTSATTLTSVKKLHSYYREALQQNRRADAEKALASLNSISIGKLFVGNINGSLGETSTVLILIGMVWLLYNKVIFIPLLIGPFIGMLIAKLFLHAAGLDSFPLLQVYLINLFAGGTFFAATFMVTEPITAPVNNKARWIYSVLIGFLATIIRSLSAFNAGFMFAILLGNTFGPLIEHAVITWEKGRKEKVA
ncbi:MAG: RnfABCDGE type electron transport complex subunit D [Candidatus Rifleibacteriota bacterium]